MRNATSHSERIFEEAAEWIVELRDGGPRCPDTKRFMDWLRTSPGHVAAYFEMAAAWEDVPRLLTIDDIDVESLVASARETPQAHSPEGPATRRDWARTVFRPATWVAALAFCIGVAVWWQLRPQTYVTDIGEQRSILLEDGSAIDLDTKSRVRVRLADHSRNIELLEGQALFHVAPDESRPFIVSSDDTHVRAVGTQFDVYRKTSGAKVVTVIEGHVAVATSAGGRERSLGPGNRLIVTAEGVVQDQMPDTAAAMAWRQRSVIFHDTALSEVVAELNRYNRKQLIIDDPSLLSIRINGVFSSRNPASLLLFLRAQPGVRVREGDRAIHIGKME